MVETSAEIVTHLFLFLIHGGRAIIFPLLCLRWRRAKNESPASLRTGTKEHNQELGESRERAGRGRERGRWRERGGGERGEGEGGRETERGGKESIVSWRAVHSIRFNETLKKGGRCQ